MSAENNAYLFRDTAIWEDQRYRQLQGTFPVIFISFKACKKDTWPKAYEYIKFDHQNLEGS